MFFIPTKLDSKVTISSSLALVASDLSRTAMVLHWEPAELIIEITWLSWLNDKLTGYSNRRNGNVKSFGISIVVNTTGLASQTPIP